MHNSTSRPMTSLVTIALVAAQVCALPAFGQTLVNDHVTQPDLWRPDRVDLTTVDARGDLNLGIPVLSVPGRNGLDFEVTFRYRSGIKTKQLSSWIGTGWSFDPGSITRDVRTAILNGITYNVDYDASPDVQPDVYYVSTPKTNFSVSRHNTGSGTTTTLPPNNATNDFVRTDWRPWRIDARAGHVDNGAFDDVECVCTQVISAEYPAGSLKEDIESWVLTDDRGTRYVYGHPTIGSFIGMYSAQSLHSMEYYVNAWRLIAILGRDYDGPIPKTPAELSKDSPGSWIRFEYSMPATTSYVDVELTGYSAVRQAAYLEAIETPTHRAEFETDAKLATEEWPQTWAGGLRSIHRQLRSIKLFTKLDSDKSGIVKQVDLVQSDRFDGFDGTSRMALDEVKLYGMGGSLPGSELPGYRLAYYGIERGLLDDYENDVDDFGYYNADSNYSINADTVDGRAWNLQSIVHPLGYREEFVYANDEICYYCQGGIVSDPLYVLPFIEYTWQSDETTGLSRNYSISSSNNRQGGTRVSQVVRYELEDGDPYSTTQYSYSGGRIAAIPSTYLEKQYPSMFFKNVDRNRAAVFYNRVRRTNADGTWTEVYYTTDVSHPDRVIPAQTAIYQINSDRIVLAGNQDMLWGKEYRVVTSEGASRETELIDDLTSFRLSQVASINGNELSNIWFYGGRRLEEVSNTYLSGALGVGHYITRQHSWTYDPVYGQVRETRSTNTGLEDRVTKFQYAFDIPEYEWAIDRNILDSIVKEDRLINDSISGEMNTFSSTVQTWDLFRGYHIDEEIVVPQPKARLNWHTEEPQTAVPIFDDWVGELSPNSSWHSEEKYVSYDTYGNPTLIETRDNANVELDYTANESRISAIVSRPSASGVLVDTFAKGEEAKWDALVTNGAGEVRIESVDGWLEVQDGGLNVDFQNDHVRYELDAPVSDKVLLEMDVIPAVSDGKSLFVSLGDDSWTNLHSGTGVGVWISISGADLLSYDRSKWRRTGAIVEPGNTVRLSVMLDLEAFRITIVWNGIEVYRVDGIEYNIDEVSVLAIGTAGASSMTGITFVDNVRLQNASDQVAHIEYDPVHLRPTRVVDEAGIFDAYNYDLAGRLSGEQKMDGSRIRDSWYRLSRRQNNESFDGSDPSFINSVSYSQNSPGLHFMEGNSWMIDGAVTMARYEDRWTAAIGGLNGIWSSLTTPQIGDAPIILVDFQMSGEIGGQPEVLTLIDDDRWLIVNVDGPSNAMCLAYSSSENFSESDCWTDFSLVDGLWYTAEIRQSQSGQLAVRVLTRSTTDQVSSTKIVDGYSSGWLPDLRIRSKDDVILVSNVYAGEYVEWYEYLDPLGRSVQKQASSASGHTAIAYEYDTMHRLIREYLPFPASSYTSTPAAEAHDFYSEMYNNADVVPFTELRYDSFGRESQRLHPRSSGEPRGISTTYTSELFFTSLSTEVGPPVEVVTVIDENQNPTASIFNALGHKVLGRTALDVDADDTFPENITIRVERENNDQDVPGGVVPQDVDINDWVEEAYDYVPSRSYLVGYRIELSIEETGQASVVLKQNGSTTNIWVFDNMQIPTVYSGYFPVLAGSEYTLEVSAGVSESDSYPGSAMAELSLIFTEGGRYRAFNETEFSYDGNGNLILVRKPSCFAEPDTCNSMTGEHNSQAVYDTDSHVIAATNANSDGDGDGDPANELLLQDRDYAYKYSSAGRLRFVEDPNSRHSDERKFHVLDYDPLGRLIGSGLYRGKYSFDVANPDGIPGGIIDWRHRQEFVGGKVSLTEYDSTQYRFRYDARGRVSNLFVQIPGLDEKEIRYYYDDLGNQVRVEYQPESEVEAFFTWYEYDRSGMLETIATNRVNHRETATSEAVYTYDAALRPEKVILGDHPSQNISYEYSLRGNVIGINDIDDEESGVFAESIGYDQPDQIALSNSQVVAFAPMYNGLASWIVSRTTGNTIGGAITGYTYEYDKLNRLVRADFGKRYGLQSDWSSSLLYDVGAGKAGVLDPAIEYDSNGNVVSFSRRNEYGGIRSADFEYRPGSDQVASSSNSISADYAFDFNGNTVFLGHRDIELTYDERNQVERVLTSAGVYEYRYDNKGRRVIKSAPDQVYYVRGLDGSILAVYDFNGEIVKWNITASGSLIGYATP
ncbi:MAG: hypothetical protein HKN43_04320 [Rhodothermales bacterium]|nr:hypothetical protein [Rhodothermales bacterium]